MVSETLSQDIIPEIQVRGFWVAGGSSTHPFTANGAGLPQRKAPRQGMTTPKETSPHALQVEESNMKDIRYWSYHPQAKTQAGTKETGGKN